MERDRIPIGVLPVRDASWHVPVFHVLGRQLTRWRALNHGRSLFTSATCDLLVLVSRGFQRVLHDIRDLDDTLDSTVCIGRRSVSNKAVFIDFFQRSRAEESRITLFIGLHAKLLPSVFQILIASLIRWSAQVRVLQFSSASGRVTQAFRFNERITFHIC